MGIDIGMRQAVNLVVQEEVGTIVMETSQNLNAGLLD